MHRTRVLVWATLLVISLAGGGALVGGAAAANTPAEFSGAKYEPDNPNCPEPGTYEDYDHNCTPPGQPGYDGPNVLGGPHTEQTWNSHWFFYGPGAHEPGYEGASWAFNSWPVKDNFDLQYYEYVAIYAPWGRMNGDGGTCDVSDTQAAGIDVGNNNSKRLHNTRSDNGVVSAIQGSNVTKTYGYFQFAGPGGAPGAGDDRNVNLNSTDSFVAALGGCWANPRDPGWYRLTVWFNGTNWQGEKMEWKGFNHWQWFCSDCKNRKDAVDKFGPPGTNPDNPWKDTTVSTTSSTKGTETVTPTPGTSTSTQTATATATATATPTPTPEQGEQTPTATPEQNKQTEPDENTPTPTAGDGTATSTSGGQGDGGQNNVQTPTGQSGPGFGLAIGLVAVLLSVARRVRRR